MDGCIQDFLAKHRVGVLSVLLPDGTLHGATLHYSHNNEPLEFYFSTTRTSRKMQGLLKGEVTVAAFVVGESEEEWLTFQADGEAMAVITKEELSGVHRIHYAKHPSSAQYRDDAATIFLRFVPKWWRFSDYNTEPVSTLSSEAVGVY